MTSYPRHALRIVFASGEPKSGNYQLGIKNGQKYLFTGTVSVLRFNVGSFSFINTMHLTPIINGSLKNKNRFITPHDFKVNVFGSDIPVEVVFDTEINDDNMSFQFVSMVAYDKSAFDADSVVEIDEYILANAIDEWNKYINEP